MIKLLHQSIIIASTEFAYAMYKSIALDQFQKFHNSILITVPHLKKDTTASCMSTGVKGILLLLDLFDKNK